MDLLYIRDQRCHTGLIAPHWESPKTMSPCLYIVVATKLITIVNLLFLMTLIKEL